MKATFRTKQKEESKIESEPKMMKRWKQKSKEKKKVRKSSINKKSLESGLGETSQIKKLTPSSSFIT